MKIYAVTLIALFSYACGGGSGAGLDTAGRPLGDAAADPVGPAAEPTSFESLQANLFTPVCTVCHAGGSAPVGLKLDQANAYAMLVSVASVEVPGLLRVSPGDPDNSYLVQKLEGTAAVGSQMPLGGPPVSTDIIASVRQWIADGALPPGSQAATNAPKVTTVTPANDAIVSDGLTSVSAVFTQAMDASLVSDLTFRLTASGGDGSFADGNEIIITPVGVTAVNSQSIAMDLTGVALPDDTYQARLVGTGATALADINGLVLDGDGDDSAGGDFTWMFSISSISNVPQASWRWIQDNVFTPVCTQCHIAGGIAAFMLLDEQNSFLSTVSVPSTEVASLNRIEPGNPDLSYLVQKLEGTAAVGDQMPQGLPPLATDVIGAIAQWIVDGVPLEPGDPMPEPTPDIEPPSVIINAVATPASGMVEVGFTTVDNIGVSVVRLYADGLLVGTDITAPFVISWDTTIIPDGLHVLSAEAEDEAGNVGMSPTLNITVANGIGDNAPPQVSILPVPDPAVGTVSLSVDATDNAAVVSVTVLIDGIELGSKTLPPYQFQWDTTATTDGLHAIDATAIDTSGNVGMATTVQVSVDNTLPPDTTAPVVAITTPPSPLAGIVNFEIDAADVSGIAVVRLFVDDVLVGSTSTAPFNVSWDSTTVTDGVHLLRAEADDNAGNTGNSNNLNITVQNAAGAQPTWRWIQDNIFTPRCISCHRAGGIADFLWLDEAASLVQLVNAPTTEGGPPLRVKPGDPDNSSLVQRLEGTLTPQMPLGGAPLSIDEIDAVRQWIFDGALPELPADTTPPSVSMVSPGNTVSGIITLSANASDETSVATVRFYIDSQLTGVDATEPYELVWDTRDFADTTHELYAEADDSSGNTATAPTIMVVVDNSLPADTEPPTASIQIPPEPLSGTAAVVINANDNVGVTLVSLTANGVLIGTASSAPFTVIWDTLSVPNGEYTLVANANDAAGNSTMSVPVIATVANTTPVITLDLVVLPAVLRGDDFPVVATINNTGAASPPLTATLSFTPPDIARFEAGDPAQSIGVVPAMSGAVVQWLMRADETGVAMITVTVTDQAGDVYVAMTVPVQISD